jgi:hypothetical protein
MTPEGNRRRLRALMKTHKLTAEDVADMLCIARGTVYAWRVRRNPMPDWAVELLTLKLTQTATAE